MVYIMDDRSVTAVQTCILLGSHHVYHGRPNLSFALLGAAIKISHALGLHRHIAQGDAEDIEERKRVWWTVYTWDRFVLRANTAAILLFFFSFFLTRLGLLPSPTADR